jgi:hypothetical protein
MKVVFGANVVMLLLLRFCRQHLWANAAASSALQ